jgi:hypothetical protein
LMFVHSSAFHTVTPLTSRSKSPSSSMELLDCSHCSGGSGDHHDARNTCNNNNNQVITVTLRSLHRSNEQSTILSATEEIGGATEDVEPLSYEESLCTIEKAIAALGGGALLLDDGGDDASTDTCQ